MVTRRKQHSSQRPVQQGPAVTASRPNKIGASTPYHFRGRKPTPYGGTLLHGSSRRMSYHWFFQRWG